MSKRGQCSWAGRKKRVKESAEWKLLGAEEEKEVVRKGKGRRQRRSVSELEAQVVSK